MPTNFLLRPDGVLRHGHDALGNPGKHQWHNASQFHRNDPDAHEREESWSNPLWSGQNWNVPGDKKAALIAEAQALHDDARQSALGSAHVPRVKVGSDSELLAPVQSADVPAAATAVTIVEEPADAGALLAGSDAALLVERVSNLEELALSLAGPFDERLTKLDQAVSDLSDKTPDVSSALAPLVERIATVETAITLMVAEREKSRTVVYEVRDLAANTTHTITDRQHSKFGLLLELATNLAPDRRNIWLAGPAGAGKTTAARNLAKALGLEFSYIGAIDSPYKISGYMNTQGVYVPTEFRRSYETRGGVFLFDEVDGSSPGALLETHAAMSNGSASFPDGLVQRHPSLIILCAANTWGLGGDANYVGRVKLDAAFLSRFATIAWDYDEDLERTVAGSPTGWVDAVQATRAAVFGASRTASAQMVISPRHSIMGCELLRAGLPPANVVEAMFGMYRKHSMWPTLGKAIEDYAAARPTAPRVNAPSGIATNGRASHGTVALGAVDFSGVRVFS